MNAEAQAGLRARACVRLFCVWALGLSSAGCEYVLGKLIVFGAGEQTVADEVDTKLAHLDVPSDGWVRMTGAATEAMNSAVDLWLLNGEHRNSIQILEETLEPGLRLDFQAYKEVVLEQMGAGDSELTLMRSEPSKLGETLFLKLTTGGDSIDYVIRLFTHDNHALQVIAFAAGGALEDDTLRIVRGAEMKIGPSKTSTRTGFVAARKAFRTRLARTAPSPQAYQPWTPGGGIDVFSYTSDGRELQGYVRLPEEGGLWPAVVYLHGGFALGRQDVEDAQVFVDAGFAVYAPAFRGENGNPGAFEMFFGEVHDALAAIDHVKGLPHVDPDRVYVFGHSSGGVLSALVALHPEAPVARTGSAGGMYELDLFDGFEVPFVDAPMERILRTPHRWIGEVARPHVACAGRADPMPHSLVFRAEARARRTGAPLIAIDVPGDHFTSLKPCMEAFVASVNEAGAQPTP